jgi:acetoacetate decarboxylase
MFATDPTALRELVPEPLMVNTEKPTMTFWLGKSNIIKPTPIAYHEAALVAPVSFPRKDQKPIPGFFPIAMYLDSSDSDLLTLGNKIWGFNKYSASVSLTREQKSITGRVTLAETQIVSLKMELPGKTAELLSFDILPYFNRRYIPGINSDKDPEIDQLAMVPFKNYQQTKRIVGGGEITMKSSPQLRQPLDEIPITKVLMASYSEGGLSFEDGSVLVDYLKQ